MRFTTLLLIVSIFTFVFDGKELCFKNNGEVHLSCCCKDSPSIKMPCCGKNCKTVEVPSIDIAQQKPENENLVNSDFYKPVYAPVFNPSRILHPAEISLLRPVYRSDHTYRPASLSNLSNIILRC
ncbi:MAG TPA: hypothetical protein PLX56_05295 [bacterium]|nr:hypothetical protein [bacterium]HQN72848.1 hypothetical protein [bacterium]HQO91730.1 hypothetical protein [bacterium]